MRADLENDLRFRYMYACAESLYTHYLIDPFSLSVGCLFSLLEM